MPNKRILAFALFGCFTGIFFTLIWSSHPGVHLPDGDILQLRGVTLGTNQFVDGTWIQKTLFRYLPIKGPIKILGWKFDEPRKLSASPSSYFGDSLNLWLSTTALEINKSGFADYWADHYRVVAVDKMGREYPNLKLPEIYSSQLCLRLRAYPRSEEAFRVKLLSKFKNSPWTTIAEFPVRNTQPVPSQHWSAQPTPIIQQINGVEVSFGGVDFVQSVPADEWKTHLLFRYRRDGAETDELRLAQLSRISDELGNAWDVLPNNVSTNGWIAYPAHFPLGGKSVWHFKGDLIRVKNFAEEDLVRFEGIPDTSEEVFVTNRNNIVVGAKILQGTLGVRLVSSDNLEIAVINAKDNTGDDLLTKNQAGSGRGTNVGLKRIPKRLSAVAAVQKLFPVEYYFEPDLKKDMITEP